MFSQLFHQLGLIGHNTRLLEILDWDEELLARCILVWQEVDLSGNMSNDDVASCLVDSLPDEFSPYQEDLYQFLVNDLFPFLATNDKLWNPVGEA
jgi:hypothetical protein